LGTQNPLLTSHAEERKMFPRSSSSATARKHEWLKLYIGGIFKLKEQRLGVGRDKRGGLGEDGIVWSRCSFCGVHYTTTAKSASERDMAWHGQGAAAVRLLIAVASK